MNCLKILLQIENKDTCRLKVLRLLSRGANIPENGMLKTNNTGIVAKPLAAFIKNPNGPVDRCKNVFMIVTDCFLIVR
jgi:hypothetical protein